MGSVQELHYCLLNADLLQVGDSGLGLHDGDVGESSAEVSLTKSKSA